MPRLRTISMLDLRQQAEKIVGDVSRGEALVLTYRGRPVIRLEPIRLETVDASDAFYQLAELADRKGRSLTNREMDAIVYGT
jgi:antitoxin (DNA-binding transcriptional repressor) of toxin-antitoxin stability system